MTRKDFLSTLGIGATFVLTSACFGSCSADNLEDISQNLDFTLDLDDPSNAALQDNDNFIIVDKIVVARTTTGAFVAATVKCSHQGLEQITLRDDEWYCTAHGSRFDLDGDGLNNNARRGLTVYQTELNGNMLRVFA